MTPTHRVDVTVIGGELEGLAAAWFAAQSGASVALVPGRTTRPAGSLTATTFSATLGPQGLEELSVLAGRFLESPPVGFTTAPLISPRSLLWIGSSDSTLDRLAIRGPQTTGSVVRLDAEQVAESGPIAASRVPRAGGVLDDGALRLDVATLAACFGRGLRATGALALADHRLRLGTRHGSRWLLDLDGVRVETTALIAAGLDADITAQHCGESRRGLRIRHLDAFEIETEVAPATLPDEGVAVADLDAGCMFDDRGPRLEVVALADAAPRTGRADIATVAALRDRAEILTDRRFDGIVTDLSHPIVLAPDRIPVVGAGESAGFVWLSGLGAQAPGWAGALGAMAARIALDLPTHAEPAGSLLARLSPRRLDRR